MKCSQAESEQLTSTSNNLLSMADLQRLFARLGALYGFIWSNQYPSTASRDIALKEWLACLKQLTHWQIEKGLKKCMESKDKFPPTAMQFKERCMPGYEDFGLVESEEAFQQAVTNYKTHPAIYHAVLDVGFFEFKNLPERMVKSRFIEAYKKRAQQMIGGVILTIPTHKMIENKPKSDLPKMSAGEAMSKVKKLLVGKQ